MAFCFMTFPAMPNSMPAGIAYGKPGGLMSWARRGALHGTCPSNFANLKTGAVVTILLEQAKVDATSAWGISSGPDQSLIMSTEATQME